MPLQPRGENAPLARGPKTPLLSILLVEGGPGPLLLWV